MKKEGVKLITRGKKNEAMRKKEVMKLFTKRRNAWSFLLDEEMLKQFIRWRRNESSYVLDEEIMNEAIY